MEKNIEFFITSGNTKRHYREELSAPLRRLGVLTRLQTSTTIKGNTVLGDIKETAAEIVSNVVLSF